MNAPRKPPDGPDVFNLERTHWAAGRARVGGVDEAGRGCLAGPVVAAAVVFAPEVSVPGVADSKTLTAARREALAPQVKEAALAWGIGVCSPAEIDRLNILHAALEAMRRAVADLAVSPQVVLVDGNRVFSGAPCPTEAVIKGDQRSHTIAAASILAKTHRDALMRALAADHPAYGWDRNKGYPTRDHYAALTTHGPTHHHRRSFRLS